MCSQLYSSQVIGVTVKRLAPKDAEMVAKVKIVWNCKVIAVTAITVIQIDKDSSDQLID
jgi:hypothetical protein